MEIPKYIQKALKWRAVCACEFNRMDYKIYQFLKKHDIEVEDYDILGGCESVVNPFDSIRRIAEAIAAHEKGKKQHE